MSRINEQSFDDLNAEQRAAVEHGLEPLLVIAGAGSGKTKTLSCRVAHLVANGADPSRILLLTFSRRAAAEMIARVGKVMAGDVRIPWAGRFTPSAHSWAARIFALLIRRRRERSSSSRPSNAECAASVATTVPREFAIVSQRFALIPSKRIGS
jgi:superfamily I DNA/RNA helicase